MDSFVWCFHFGIFPSPQHPCLNARIDPILLHAHDTLANGDNAGLHSPNDLTDTMMIRPKVRSHGDSIRRKFRPLDHRVQRGFMRECFQPRKTTRERLPSLSTHVIPEPGKCHRDGFDTLDSGFFVIDGSKTTEEVHRFPKSRTNRHRGGQFLNFMAEGLHGNNDLRLLRPTVLLNFNGKRQYLSQNFRGRKSQALGSR
jgi:hypothetical protein